MTRERASFEVRDVHPTQYGRICPIATPEGPNIGLVLHLASFSKVDKYGFILTPFRKVKHTVKNDGSDAVNKIALGDILNDKGEVVVEDKAYITKEDALRLQSEVSAKEIEVRGYLVNDYDYFDAHQERVLVIAEANSEIDAFGNFTKTRIGARSNSEPTLIYVREVSHIDISPKQIMSIDTALLPFLEHDDATRAEMGTNMMRQAVPLVRPESPVVGTGMERIV